MILPHLQVRICNENEPKQTKLFQFKLQKSNNPKYFLITLYVVRIEKYLRTHYISIKFKDMHEVKRNWIYKLNASRIYIPSLCANNWKNRFDNIDGHGNRNTWCNFREIAQPTLVVTFDVICYHNEIGVRMAVQVEQQQERCVG